MAMFMVVLLSVGMSSCGGDDDDDDDYTGGDKSSMVEKLQGTWEIYSGTMTYEGITITRVHSTDTNQTTWNSGMQH